MISRKPKQTLKSLHQILKDFWADLNSHTAPPAAYQASQNLIFSLLLASYLEEHTTAGMGPIKDLAHSQTGFNLTALRSALSFHDNTFKVQLFSALDWDRLESYAGNFKRLSQALLDLSKQLTFSDLNYSFEGFLRHSAAKKEGVFCTPPALAASMVQELLCTLKDSRQTKYFIDPACGSGIFLLELLRQICQAEKYESLSSKLKFIQSSIYGVDKDPKAVEMCRLMLFLCLSSEKQPKLFHFELLPTLHDNIKVGDSLISPQSDADQKLFASVKTEKFVYFDWRNEFAGVFAENGGFDGVIGNPPYGLARGEQLSVQENILLKAQYEQFRSGKINKYLAFMARGFELLRKGGVLSLLVPNAWLGIQGGKPLRASWLKGGALKKINLFECQVFDDPSVEAVTFVVVKDGGFQALELQHCSNLQYQPASEAIKLPISECLKTPDCVIPLNWSSQSSDLFYQIKELSFDLGGAASDFNPLIALQAYSVGKGDPPQSSKSAKERIFHSDRKEDKHTYPYLEGADVGRFALNWSGSFLKYGPWLAEPQTLERFSGPRIVLREIIRPKPYLLAGCFVKDIYLYNKSVLHILPKSSSSENDLWILLGILNSKLASFIINFSGRKSQRRLFPKIVNADLLNFPLAKNFAEAGKRIAQLARNLSDRNRSPDSASLAAVNSELDHEVYKLYQLKNSQVALCEA